MEDAPQDNFAMVHEESLAQLPALVGPEIPGWRFGAAFSRKFRTFDVKHPLLERLSRQLMYRYRYIP